MFDILDAPGPGISVEWGFHGLDVGLLLFFLWPKGCVAQVRWDFAFWWFRKPKGSTVAPFCGCQKKAPPEELGISLLQCFLVSGGVPFRPLGSTIGQGCPIFSHGHTWFGRELGKPFRGVDPVHPLCRSSVREWCGADFPRSKAVKEPFLQRHQAFMQAPVIPRSRHPVVPLLPVLKISYQPKGGVPPSGGLGWAT